MIYRIIMELTSNIIRHSKATDATIQLVYHEKQLAIMAEDNGKGFIANAHAGIGLKNIHSRVNYLNGTMNIDSGTHGTTAMFHIPYKKQQDE
jgi:signal transduction histidine kinase